MCDIPQTELAFDVDSTEGEELRPGMCRLERLAVFIISMVEGLWKAKEIHKPVHSDYDGWYPVTPAPADIEGRKSTSDGGHVCAVCHTG